MRKSIIDEWSIDDMMGTLPTVVQPGPMEKIMKKAASRRAFLCLKQMGACSFRSPSGIDSFLHFERLFQKYTDLVMS